MAPSSPVPKAILVSLSLLMVLVMHSFLHEIAHVSLSLYLPIVGKKLSREKWNGIVEVSLFNR